MQFHGLSRAKIFHRGRSSPKALRWDSFRQFFKGRGIWSAIVSCKWLQRRTCDKRFSYTSKASLFTTHCYRTAASLLLELWRWRVASSRNPSSDRELWKTPFEEGDKCLRLRQINCSCIVSAATSYARLWKCMAYKMVRISKADEDFSTKRSGSIFYTKRFLTFYPKTSFKENIR